MTNVPGEDASRSLPNPLDLIDSLGNRALQIVSHTGVVVLLVIAAARWVYSGCVGSKRIGRAAIVSQIVRIGVRSIFIVSLVSASVGIILALNMAPPLDQFGSKELVANIIGVSVLRELGPLMAAIVLTGFAGAAIAAEIGTMVVREEIEALEVMALDPVHFLVVPRLVASILSMISLAVISNIVAVGGAMIVSRLVLGIPIDTFWMNMLSQLKSVDFWTGMTKAAIFGMLIGAIACANGLRTSGGAAGVGKATTSTVVQCIVSIIIADTIFTAIFFIFDLN
ncbi:MAG TPA: ABC transporter permease [Phycisphaerales bacterium]|nr:ABC transporter permease [Phycisphaerales bacterium]